MVRFLKIGFVEEFCNIDYFYTLKTNNILQTLIDEFNFPAYNRSLKLLKQANVTEVTALTDEMTKTYDLLKESKDHVRFLGTIEESLELIATTENFSKLIEIIPGVAVSLRNIWLLSKYFNTDKKIHDLILMISRNVDYFFPQKA